MTLELHLIKQEDRTQLAEAAQRYWRELMPHAPVVREVARRQQYFEERFPFGRPDHLLWWAVVEGANVGFASVVQQCRTSRRRKLWQGKHLCDPFLTFLEAVP